MVLSGKAARTQEAYIGAVVGLALHYKRSPEQLSADEVQRYLLHLLRDRHLSLSSVNRWKAYFGVTEVLSPLREQLDKWIRRRLRMLRMEANGDRGAIASCASVACPCAKHGTSARALMAHGESRKPRHYRWRCQRASSAQWACQNWRQPGPDAHAFNAANRRVRDPYARWCGREGS
jgi:hypothetical protein